MTHIDSSSGNSQPANKAPERKSKPPAILITGASSGIGFEFAHVLSEKTCYPLILAARRQNRLNALRDMILSKKGLEDRVVECVPVDLIDMGGRNSLIKHCEDYQIEILVNNAGFGSYGAFHEADLEWELNMIKLNCEALVHLSRHFLPSMVKARKGHIINVSSMASFQGLPWLANYAATKAFVTSFSLGIAAELKGSGVNIQALCPGPVATEFVDVSGFPDKISVIPSISARSVAELSVNKMLNGNQRIVIPGFLNNVLAQLNRLFPRAVASDIACRVLKNKFKIND